MKVRYSKETDRFGRRRGPSKFRLCSGWDRFAACDPGELRLNPNPDCHQPVCLLQCWPERPLATGSNSRSICTRISHNVPVVLPELFANGVSRLVSLLRRTGAAGQGGYTRGGRLC